MLSSRIVTRAAAVVLAAATGLIACQPVDQTPAIDKTAEAQAVEQVSMNWLEASKAHDLDGVMALIAPDAVFFSEDEAPAQGADAIRAEAQDSWKEYPNASIDWKTTSVQVADAGDMAWEWGTWTFDPDGPGEAQPAHGAYVTIYKKIDGAWKAASDIYVRTESSGMEEGEAMEDSTKEPPSQ